MYHEKSDVMKRWAEYCSELYTHNGNRKRYNRDITVM